MYRVVLVDDEQLILRGLSTVIPWQEMNCEVVGTATNGRTGLELIREKKPDIILSAYTSDEGDDHAITDALPMIPNLGVMSAAEIMERWIRLMNTKRKGEWESDRKLFEKYFQ